VHAIADIVVLLIFDRPGDSRVLGVPGGAPIVASEHPDGTDGNPDAVRVVLIGRYWLTNLIMTDV